MTSFDVTVLPNDDWETVVSTGIALAQDMDLHGGKCYNVDNHIRNAPAQLPTAGGVSQRSERPMTTPIISPENPQLKTCMRCGETLPVSAFSVNRSKKDGYNNVCKPCDRAHYHEWIERRINTPCPKCGHVMETGNCKVCQKARDRSPERREDRRVRARNRRQMHGAKDITLRLVVDIYKAQGGRCYLCGVELTFDYEIDHFIPVTLGGTNDPGNLRLACKGCNRGKKGGKHPHDMGVLI